MTTSGDRGDQRRHRVLVVTDTVEPSATLTDAVRHRAETHDAQFRLVVLNPARAEVHLLHPERHDKALEAEAVLRTAVPLLEAAVGAPVIGSVSVRHDPMDAIEEALHDGDFHEIVLSTLPHSVTRWLHIDLPHRVSHLGLPTRTVTATATDRSRQPARELETDAAR